MSPTNGWARGCLCSGLPHHALNFGWHRSLFRGKYMPVRAMQTLVNPLLLAAMLGTMVSAVILSREVFAFLLISGGIALARPMHIFCSFWSFVLMALHLGLHWKMVLGMVRWVTGPVSSPALRGTLRIGGAAVAVYGLYALVKNQMVSYQSSFVFFDFERPLPLFFTEYPSWGCLFFWPTTVRGECSG